MRAHFVCMQLYKCACVLLEGNMIQIHWLNSEWPCQCIKADLMSKHKDILHTCRLQCVGTYNSVIIYLIWENIFSHIQRREVKIFHFRNLASIVDLADIYTQNAFFCVYNSDKKLELLGTSIFIQNVNHAGKKQNFYFLDRRWHFSELSLHKLMHHLVIWLRGANITSSHNSVSSWRVDYPCVSAKGLVW